MIEHVTAAGSTLAVFGLPGGMEWIVLLLLGLIIFGRRLPEVVRSIGRSIVEFKKGVRGIEDEIDEESRGPSEPARLSDHDRASRGAPFTSEQAQDPAAATPRAGEQS